MCVPGLIICFREMRVVISSTVFILIFWAIYLYIRKKHRRH